MLKRDKHIKYFRSCLERLPYEYVGLESGLLSGIYFAVTALDLLGVVDDIDKQSVIDHVYSLQIQCSQSSQIAGHNGFIGSSYFGQPYGACLCSDMESFYQPSIYMNGHLAMDYTAISLLLTLGDDLSRLDIEKLVQGISQLQQPDGSFRATLSDGECDMRYLYCACAVSALLNNWSSVDKDRAVSFITSCLTYEGGLSLTPGAEAHGGSTYCGIASLALMNRLDALTGDRRDALIYWCLQRQVGGFNGRTNKDADSCYSFWIGATLKILNSFDLTDVDSTAQFVLGRCQLFTGTCVGGFCKADECPPDILHSFYSIAWLSMTEHEGLRTLSPSLGMVTERVLASVPKNRLTL